MNVHAGNFFNRLFFNLLKLHIKEAVDSVHFRFPVFTLMSYSIDLQSIYVTFEWFYCMRMLMSGHMLSFFVAGSNATSVKYS